MDDGCHGGNPAGVECRPGEVAARRLHATVRAACAGGHDLPTRLEAGLRAALELLAREPDLARLLTVDPPLAAEERRRALDTESRWQRRFARLLDDAAAGDPLSSAPPPLCGPFLIAGVRFLVGRMVADGKASELPRLLPELLEVLLAYYVEPGELRHPVRVTPDG